MTRLAVAVGLASLLAMAPRALAEPVELRLAPCLRGEDAAIHRAVEIELGSAPPGDEVARVEIACDGPALLLTATGVRGALRFRVDPAGVPPAARARLIGLLVAEIIAASRVEIAPDPVARSLEPVPRPPPRPLHQIASAARAAGFVDARPGSAGGSIDADARGGATLQGLAAARSLGSRATTFGAGVAAAWPLGERAALAGDLTAEGGVSPVGAGDVRIALASIAPRLVARARHRSLVVEAGAGVRVGFARLSGEPSARAMLAGRAFGGVWGGPIAVAAVRFPLVRRLHLGLGVEAGYTTLSIVGRVPMSAPVELRGAWLALHLSAGVEL